MDRDRSVRLANALEISYLEVGPPSGRPVLYLHGTPSSRMEASGPLGAVATELGLRLLAPDRPGYGGSTFVRYTVRDYPRHVADFLDAVEVGGLGVVGVSGVAGTRAPAGRGARPRDPDGHDACHVG